MSRTEYSDTYRRESGSRITHREFLLQGMENLTLLNDTLHDGGAQGYRRLPACHPAS